MKCLNIKHRPRRLRKTQSIRELVCETRLNSKQFIQPYFVVEGINQQQKIDSLPGIYRYSLDKLYDKIDKLLEVGVSSALLFPYVDQKKKDKYGSIIQDQSFFLYKIIKELSNRFPQLTVITDVALDPYTNHGHDGLIDENGNVLNDETIPILANMALEQANAGASIISPSDMMDGRIGYIRKELDENGFKDVLLMSYTAKYSSNFYGPFRNALKSELEGDKKTYQMDPANYKQALLEAKLDIKEGADIIMVKPGLAYLDIVKLFNQNFNLPIAVYNVSGEYAMLKSAAMKGWINYEKCLLEIFQSFNRAGANIIISYSSFDVGKLLK